MQMVGLPNHRNTGLRQTDHWVSGRNLIETNHLGVLTSTIGASPQFVWHGRYGTAGSEAPASIGASLFGVLFLPSPDRFQTSSRRPYRSSPINGRAALRLRESRENARR